MPSPFPGMDPFLESLEYFPTLHAGLIFCIQETLQAELPDGYFAKTGERVWIDTSKRWIEPDVLVGRASIEGRGQATAVLTSPAKPVIVSVPHDERTEPYLEIYLKRGDKKRLVCSLEVLSLTNKTPNEKGQKLYRREQRELLNRKVHIVEIDLLRAGHHATAVALDRALEQTGPFDYHVCVRRFDQFEDFAVYPILMQQTLPTIAIPLLPGDIEVPLDLQTIFRRVYDAGPYRRELDYRTEKIEPPLTSEQDRWMRTVLRAAGIARTSRARHGA